MRFTILGPAALTAIGLAITGSANAQDTDGPECGAFVVTSNIQSGAFTDTGEEGHSPGDMRIFHSAIRDLEGNHLGRLDVRSTVMHPTEEGEHVLFVDLMWSFPNGTLRSTEITTSPDALDLGRLPSHEIPGIISGGTGEFAHATGMTAARSHEVGVFEVSFDLICP